MIEKSIIEVPELNNISEVQTDFNEFTCKEFNGTFKKDHYVLTFMNNIFDDTILAAYSLTKGHKLYPKDNTLEFNFGVVVLVMKNGLITTLSTNEQAEVSYSGKKKYIPKKLNISNRVKDVISKMKTQPI